ncbi:tRNA glutamyl-Q(34) synthetase GluQRS [Kangiella shandongensis]|uniref:tRNA glutamyl-Q(34) synthetase GluQRS n=1 Tax=Kangiella shandongensis TaxID=2763258 RepID=UPI001CBB7F77|nr:tRNA glutamyl-Q(34) synthetase GluQRS [Kangiella shandongensis]
MPKQPEDKQQDSRTHQPHEFGGALSTSQINLIRGRFAPSPSGPLHFGSLIAAVGSFLIAKTCNAEWQVRIEDIDPPREIEGATDTILRQLEAFGLHWDGPVIYQSESIPRFQHILAELQSNDLLYACNCTRKKVNAISDNGRYPNICSTKDLSFDGEVAWKLRHGQADYSFVDQIQGACHFANDLYREDFTVKRKDGLMAYQLAVVVDDIDAGIDHVVRGSDLLDSTPRQLRLYEVLGKEPPLWYHLPVAINQDGNKLSKQNHAEAITEHQASQLLVQALQFLGQKAPAELQHENVESIIDWALEYFSIQKIPQKQQIPYFD